MIRIDYVKEAKLAFYNNDEWSNTAYDLFGLIEEMQQMLDDLCDQIEGIERMEDEGT
jgi:hypothetical protein